jgi:hypothetical protein
MTIRPGHVRKMLYAQREFDRCSLGGPNDSEAGRAQWAAILGALYRNGTDEEYQAFRAHCTPAGRYQDGLDD